MCSSSPVCKNNAVDFILLAPEWAAPIASFHWMDSRFISTCTGEVHVVLLYKMPEFRAAATIIGGVLNYISCGYIMSVCKSSSGFFLITHLSGIPANHLLVLPEDKQGFSHCPVALDFSCYLHVDGDIPGNWGNARPQAALQGSACYLYCLH